MEQSGMICIKMKRKLMAIILVMFFVGVASAGFGLSLLTPEVSLSLSERNSLREVGDGISNPELISRGCDAEQCHFVIYEENAINKGFKIPVDDCRDYNDAGDCIRMYDYSDAEIEALAEEKMTTILKNIASVHEDRKISKTDRFADSDISIGGGVAP